MTIQSLTATTASARSAEVRSTAFRDTLASEWVKLTALRSTYLMLGLGIFLSVATTVISTAAVAATQDTWPEEIDLNLFWLIGNIFVLIIFSVFGVLTATREYSSGMIRLTLTATPSRARVYLAKLTIVFGTTLVCGMVATLGMYFAGRVILGSYDVPMPGLGNADMRYVVFSMGASVPLFPVIGFALGVLMRSAAGAITTVLALLWLPVIFAGVLPIWGQENIISRLPGTAIDSITIARVIESPTYSPPAIAATVATAWLVAFIGGAYLAFSRRDA